MLISVAVVICAVIVSAIAVMMMPVMVTVRIRIIFQCSGGKRTCSQIG